MKIKIENIFNLYEETNFVFNPGLTCLIGKNGAGKTTLIKELNRRIKGKKFYYDNVESEKFANDELLNVKGDVKKLFRNISGSEGQNIQFNFEDKIIDIGRYIRYCEKNKQNQAIILLDGLDSGISLDYAIKLKKELFDLIIKDCKNSEIEPYIIISANNFEFCNNEDCIDVTTAKHYKFNNYDEFRKFYIKEVKK